MADNNKLTRNETTGVETKLVRVSSWLVSQLAEAQDQASSTGRIKPTFGQLLDKAWEVYTR